MPKVVVRDTVHYAVLGNTGSLYLVHTGEELNPASVILLPGKRKTTEDITAPGGVEYHAANELIEDSA